MGKVVEDADPIDAPANNDHVERRVSDNPVDPLLACFGHDVFLRGGALRHYGLAYLWAVSGVDGAEMPIDGAGNILNVGFSKAQASCLGVLARLIWVACAAQGESQAGLS